jgi:hypothetical protein
VCTWRLKALAAGFAAEEAASSVSGSGFDARSPCVSELREHDIDL